MEVQGQKEETIRDAVTCPWCHTPSSDSRSWLHLRSRVLHFCPVCATQIRNSLGILQFLAREMGIKLGIRKA
jgi:hypothetical protein